MKNKKTIKFPITYRQRRKNELGPLVVECEVSSRFFRFSESSSLLNVGEFITIDVMTANGNRQRKICSLIVTRENMEKALRNIHPDGN
jgi:hypothetical protein